MSPKLFSKILSYLPQIIAMLFLAGFVAYAWTEPASAPPEGNVAAPINVSSNTQILDSKTLKMKSDGNGSLLLIGLLNVARDAIFDANICIGGVCKSAWPASGASFWDIIGNNIYNTNSGNVGIGTNNPQGDLDVGGGKLVVTTEGAVNFTAGPIAPNNSALTVDAGGPYAVWNTGGGNVLFSDDTRVIASGGVGSLCGGINNSCTNFLKITGFNFSLPANAVIDGIEVEFERIGSAPSGYSRPLDNGVFVVKNGVIGGNDKSLPFPVTWPAADAYQSYGGPTDKWGLSWTPTDINSVNFGVAISAKVAGDLDDGWGGVGIDHVRLKIYYHTGGTDIVKTNGKIRASQGTPIYSCPDIDPCAGTEQYQDESISYHTCDGRVSLSATCVSVRNAVGGVCGIGLTSFSCSWLVE